MNFKKCPQSPAYSNLSSYLIRSNKDALDDSANLYHNFGTFLRGTLMHMEIKSQFNRPVHIKFPCCTSVSSLSIIIYHLCLLNPLELVLSFFLEKLVFNLTHFDSCDTRADVRRTFLSMFNRGSF